MPSSTGSQLEPPLQKRVDLLWVDCVNCATADRQATWDRGLQTIRAQVGAGFMCAAMEDAIQDMGFRLGIFHCNAQAARFYGAAMGGGAGTCARAGGQGSLASADNST